jgi:phosphate transporter
VSPESSVQSPHLAVSSALKFNAVSEWWDSYIAYVTSSVPYTILNRFNCQRYDSLKKAIYQLEKQQHGLSHSAIDLESHERTSLMGRIDESATDAVFIPLLDRELKKITAFYTSQETELLEELEELDELVKEQEEAGLAAGDRYLDDDDDDDEDEDDEDEISSSPPISREGTVPPKRRRRKSTSASYGVRFPTGLFSAPHCYKATYSMTPTRGSSCARGLSGSASLQYIIQ